MKDPAAVVGPPPEYQGKAKQGKGEEDSIVEEEGTLAVDCDDKTPLDV